MTNGNNNYWHIISVDIEHIISYEHTQYCYIPDGVHCSDGLRISDGLRKGNSRSTEKPALELSCILLFRQRKEVLSYILVYTYTP